MKNIDKIQKIMKTNNIDACIIPTGDPHCSEYIPDHYKIRQWASGFTGSAGTLVVLQQKSALWTDSRYYIQAEKELQNSGITLMKDGLEETPEIQEWISGNVDKGSRVYINSELISYAGFNKMNQHFKSAELDLLDYDICSQIWKNRPPLPSNPIFSLDEPPADLSPAGLSRRKERSNDCPTSMSTSPAGLSRRKERSNDYRSTSNSTSTLDDSATKLQKLQTTLKKQNVDLHLITSPTQICWLLNLRGADIKYTPIFLSYMLVTQKNIILFADKQKFKQNTFDSEQLEYKIIPLNTDTLDPLTIHLLPYEQIYTYFRQLETSNKKILVDNNTINAKLYQIIEKKFSITKTNISPVDKMKAVKTDYEVAGIKKALHKDSIALCKLIHNLKTRVQTETINELNISNELASLKAEHDSFIEESFETISAYGTNAAIVHYSPQKKPAKLQNNGFLLIDTGTQYRHGTTDSTRTIALGKLSDEEKRAYTIVLKSHISLICSLFPKGTNGTQLDAIAKMHYWNNGMDFFHGTGHGVGYCLSVHEGPNSISPRSKYKFCDKGVITTIEPGFYKENKFGIRLENMTVNVDSSSYKDFLCFEPLFFFPFERDAIIPEMLTKGERKWLNNYHVETYARISPFLKSEVAEWLKNATQPI